MLPEQIDVVALQPLVHGLVHLVEGLVVGGRQLVENGVAELVLGHCQVFVSWITLVSPASGVIAASSTLTLGVLGQLFRREDARYILSIDGDDLVFLVEQFGPSRLPLTALLQCEEDKPTVTVDIAFDAIELEALRDGGLHFADSTALGEVDFGERAVLSVHDEVAIGPPFLGDRDEVVDLEAARPC